MTLAPIIKYYLTLTRRRVVYSILMLTFIHFNVSLSFFESNHISESFSFSYSLRAALLATNCCLSFSSSDNVLLHLSSYRICGVQFFLFQHLKYVKPLPSLPMWFQVRNPLSFGWCFPISYTRFISGYFKYFIFAFNF